MAILYMENTYFTLMHLHTNGSVMQVGQWPASLSDCISVSNENPRSFSLMAGSCQESPDVCSAGGGGNPQRADQGAGGEEQPAREGEQPPEEPGQP